MGELPEKTLGEIRVRTEFNPANNKHVDNIKQKTAELINLVEDISVMSSSENPNEGSETIRLKKLAQTAYEEAAMWAVKACTA